MNYDRSLMTRALMRAGQERITDEDAEKQTAKWKAVTDFYMSTLLLLLSEADWTGMKKRTQLTDPVEDNLTAYAYGYTLPEDCARAIEIQGNDDYSVEGRLIYCNVRDPILLYITNGKRHEYTELPEENVGQIVYQGKTWSWQTHTIEADPEDPESQETVTEGYEEDEVQEDNPLYDNLDLPEELREAFEYHLAAQISLKITGDKNLYNLLMEFAMAIEDRSRKTSRGHAKNKQKGHVWWSETLGIPSMNDDGGDDYAHY